MISNLSKKITENSNPKKALSPQTLPKEQKSLPPTLSVIVLSCIVFSWFAYLSSAGIPSPEKPQIWCSIVH